MRIRHGSSGWVAIPFLALTTTGCTAIFGMEEGELGAIDAGTDAATSTGGTGGTGAAGGMGGSSGTGGGGGAAGATGGTGGTHANGGSAGQAGMAGSAGSAGMAGSAGCDLVTHACVSPPGGSWSVLFAHAPASQGCQGPFATELGVLHDNLPAPSSSCDCNCDSPTESCSSDINVGSFNSDVSCSSAVSGGVIDPDTCHNMNSYSWNIIAPSANGSCAAGTVTGSFGTPTWGVDRVACAPAAGLPCADAGDSCVPLPDSPFSPGICVMQSDEVPCPAGFTNRTVFYENYADARSCPPSCTCTQTGGHCRLPLTAYAGIDCTGTDQSTTVIAPFCVTNDNYDSFHVGTPTVGNPGFCTPTDPSVIGSVEKSNPVTVCCHL